MKVNLNIKYPESEYAESGTGRQMDGKEISFNVINFGITDKYGIQSNGAGQVIKIERMTREQSKMWAKIQDQLEEESDIIDFSKERFDFIYEVVKNHNYPAQFSRARTRFEEELERVKLESEKEEGNAEGSKK